MNITIHTDNLRYRLSFNLAGWRTPAFLAVLVLALGWVVYAGALKLAEKWVQDNDSRVTEMVERRLAQGSSERNELWRNTVSRLEQDITNLSVKLWRVSALANEIVDRLGLGEEIKVEIPETPSKRLPPLEQGMSPSEEFSEMDSHLYELAQKAERESFRLDQIGSSTSVVAMQRITIPVRTPIVGRFWRSSNYGYRRDPFTGRRTFHAGYDFAARTGTTVLAGASGIVTHLGRAGNYGKMIEVYHGSGTSTIYAHLSDYKVRLWELVAQGQPIASVGNTGRSTGPHLHYEVRLAGRPRSYKKMLDHLLEERSLVAATSLDYLK